MTIPITTAAERYAEVYTQTSEALDELTLFVNRSLFDPDIDWGHVGDIAHIRDALNELLTSLKEE